MAKVKLYLTNKNDEKVVHETKKLTGRAVRKAFEVMEKLETETSYVKQLDGLIDYVVDVFDNEKVTEDSILDGIASEKLMEELQGVVTTVVGGDKQSNGKAKK
ncbi:phage tail assembly chaperone G [Vagococcus entomophilus]|uniref:Phage tail protein n=1 Tax=Vagococcus entomophilus TaxID=1160095 RepID=A0A430AK07_9ENTE|nr:hypothetical protein [Vagococcus entomophilus]RSU08430.1 hypothetical protein CBF30_04105 [Vagococcus entomophilus]